MKSEKEISGRTLIIEGDEIYETGTASGIISGATIRIQAN